MKREMNFENFYVYDGNKVAYLAAQKVVEFPGELFNPLYIYGGTGLGKTHLLWTIFSELDKKSKTLFFSAKDFEKSLEETIEFDTPIVVDDFHTISKEYHEVILGIIDTFLANNRQICLSGDAAPRALKDFDVRLLSRLEGGLVCDIQPPKEIALVDMIKKKSGEAGILLPDEIALELAQISTGSIRVIEGMINRLIAYSSLGHVSLDVNSVHMILKDFYPKGIYSPVSSLLEELKKDASEVLQDMSEKLDEHEEYKEKIYIWEMKGFDTSSLKLLIDGDLDLLKREYDNFIQKVKKLFELQKEFSTIDVDKFPDEAMKIESMLFSPDNVDEIRKLIADIKGIHVVDADKGFENFVVGESDANVFDVYTNQVLKNLGQAFNPFIIYGEKGTGKTRFLEAVYIDLISKNKSVKFVDLGSSAGVPRLDDIEVYDVLLFDNFHNIFAAPEEVRKRVFDCITACIKADKPVIFSSYALPPDVSLSEDESFIFSSAIETEIKTPSTDVVEKYLKSKLPVGEAQEIIDKGFPRFTSFYEINGFLDSRKEVVLVEIPREETEQKIEVPEEIEIVPLGFPGEESIQREEIKEAVAKEIEGLAMKRESEEKIEELRESIDDEKFLMHEVSGELIEDNY